MRRARRLLLALRRDRASRRAFLRRRIEARERARRAELERDDFCWLMTLV